MSQWKFNDFKTDIDFTDADFMEKFENAYDDMMRNVDNVPKIGKVSERIWKQCEVFDTFFTTVFGPGATDKMFGTKKSVETRVAACNSLYDFKNAEDARYKSMVSKYKPNRQQRRSNEKHKRRS